MNLATWNQTITRELRLSGFQVQEYHQPGRPALHQPECLMLHWTASRRGDHPSIGTVIQGRPGVSGPLYHWVVGRGGSLHCITDGYANHAGVGNAAMLDVACRGEMTLETPFATHDAGSGGNRRSIGISLELTEGEEISAAQFESVTVLSALLLREMGRHRGHMMMHDHYTPRKIDLTHDQYRKIYTEVGNLMELEAALPIGPHGLRMPRYEPAIHMNGRIVDYSGSGKGMVILTDTADIYCFGVRYRGSPNDDPRSDYELIGRPVQVRADEYGYTVYTDRGYSYRYD